MKQVLLLLPALLAIGLLVGGCGDSNDATPATGPQSKEIRAVFRKANDTFFAKQFAATCSYYSPRGQQQIKDLAKEVGDTTGGPCRKAEVPIYATIIDFLDAKQREAVRTWLPDEISIDGDRATAIVHDPPPALAGTGADKAAGQPTELIKVRGRWLIDHVPEPEQ